MDVFLGVCSLDRRWSWVGSSMELEGGEILGMGNIKRPVIIERLNIGYRMSCQLEHTG